MNRRKVAFLAVLTLLAGGVSVFAQAGATGQIVGTVVDQTGAGVAAASVTLTNVATSEVRQTVTNALGDYVFPLVTPGRYKLEVSAAGFKSVVIESVDVRITQTTRVDVTLLATAPTEVVTVTAE
ncbi:MAG TPA: carboxypeptidase-like regulatory domain-containing protein, partial [Blastocatellia bacterium]|nr:carboxypeptidase-like regulatory domain-containing protein [Blastocatellia bacterium]